jgi:hypothetical protein
VCFLNSYPDKRLTSAEGRYNTSFSSSFRGLLSLPSISSLTIPLPSGVVSLFTVNIVGKDPLFGV